MTSKSALPGILAMLGATASFVSTDTLAKIAMSDLPPLQVLFLRNVSATLWCGAAIVFYGLTRQLGGMGNRYVLLRSAAETGGVVAFFICLAQMPIADITAIIQIAPLIVLVAFAVIYKEVIGLWRWALILLGFLGALLVANPGAGGFSPVLLIALLIPFGAGLRDVFTRGVPAGIHGLVPSFAVILMVLTVAGIGHFAFEQWADLAWRHALLFAAAGLFLMFGQILILAAFRIAEARVVAPLLYSFMLWATLSGIFVFGDPLTWNGLAGMAMIVASGMALTLFAPARKS